MCLCIAGVSGAPFYGFSPAILSFAFIGLSLEPFARCSLLFTLNIY